MKSFRQVYTELGENRTTVQYWIDKILCRPKQDERDNTPLQFTSKEVRQLWVIKIYKELGYSNSEIKSIINGESFDFEKAYEEHIEKLQREKERLEKMIDVASYMKNSSIKPDTIGIDLFDGLIDCDDSISLFRRFNSLNVVDEKLNEEIIEHMYPIFEKLSALLKKGFTSDTDETQALVRQLHSIISKYCGEFIYTFKYFSETFTEEDKKRIDTDLGCGTHKYIHSAIDHYCKTCITDSDEELMSLFESLAVLFKNGESEYSEKVKQTIDKLEKLSSTPSPCDALTYCAYIFEDEAFIKIFKKDQLDGFHIFFKNAINHYYKR